MAVTVQDRIDSTREAIRTLRQPQPRDTPRPPGPPGLRSLIRLVRGAVEPQEFFTGVSRRYQPLAHVPLGREHVYVLSDPDVIWDAFVSQGRTMAKARGVQLTRPLLGNGLLTSEGAQHRRNRRLVQPAFHRTRIQAYSHDMVAAADQLSQRWRELTAGGPAEIDVVEQISALTLDVVGRTLFEADLTGDAAEVGDALNVALESFTKLASPLTPATSRLPLPQRRRLLAAIERLDAVVADLIQRQKAAIARGEGDGSAMSLLLQTVDEDTGERLDDDEVRDEVMTLVLAGHETTAMALSWTLRDLTMNPAAREWLREELDALPERPLGFADLAALPRTYATIAEGMRLHPPAWIIGRYTREAITLAGWPLPAGSVVLASQYALHTDPRYWRSPDRFEPARWITAAGTFDERQPGQPRGAWFPFGFGTRRCIGEQFAWVEAVLVLATLLREWDVRVVDPKQTQIMAAVTLRPRAGLPAVVARR